MLNERNTEAATLEAVLVPENLQAAWLSVKANGGAAGVDGMDIEQTSAHLKEHWVRIEAQLLGGNYRPGAVKAVEIPKPNGGVRTLGIPNVQDRLIEQAIHQQLRPLWEADFSAHSHGFRPNRSAHEAVREAQDYIRSGKKWVVDIELQNFFDEIDHDILMNRIALKVRDKRLLRPIETDRRDATGQPSVAAFGQHLSGSAG